MTGTITMTDEQWAELRNTVHALVELATKYTVGETQNTAIAAECDLLALIAEVDDENTRARYMALAADDQLSLFDGAPV